MADDEGVIGESEVALDVNDRIRVLSGPLKGMDGYITKFNRRRGQVTVNFLLGTERHKISLSVKLVEEDTRSYEEILWGTAYANADAKCAN
jgi:transcriptional antiterminator NusG